jgi:hypothetical protein
VRAVNIAWLAGAALLLAAAILPARADATDNTDVERLATCQDSWFEWKASAPARLKNFADRFQVGFTPTGSSGGFAPKSSQTVAGLPLAQVYPQSVGMGVGFSVVVNANFEATKVALEKRLGKRISKCEPPSDNMRTCELEIGEKKTITLMAEDNPKTTTTLFGCYYFYEK